jgi:hypothetical protein
MVKRAIDYTDGKSAKRPRRTRARTRAPGPGGRGGGIEGRVLLGRRGEGRQMQFGGKKKAKTRVGRHGTRLARSLVGAYPREKEKRMKEREGKRTDIPLASVEFKGNTHTRYSRCGGAARSKSHPRRDAYSHLRRTGAAGVLRARTVGQQRNCSHVPSTMSRRLRPRSA